MNTTADTLRPSGSTHPYASLPTPPASDEPITLFRDEHRFLSNFWFVPEGVHYAWLSGPTVEHVFQALKTTDELDRSEILAARRPGEAKKLGSKVTLRPDWESVKLGVMANLQASKYRDPALRALLLGTGDAELVEGNHWCDTFWGRCTCAKHADEGQNWLGRILMVQRSVLSVTRAS